MATEKEPREKAAETEHDRESVDEMSLVDYFDQMDRDAFRRALESRDLVYPVFSNS
jgi:hypothetical protein